MRGSFARANLGIICLTFGSLSLAQVPPVLEQPVASRPVIPVWPGTMPGTARPASQHESTMVVPYDHMHIVRNVTVPTLTLFLPKSNPSKTAVIVAPGGGFRVLAIEAEGYSVAEWFSQHGMAAFVLKYRLTQTPASDEEFMPSKPPAGAPGAPGAPGPRGNPMLAPLPEYVEQDAVADGIQAIRDVRANAGKWGIAPDRILMVGFSAGGVVTSGAMLAESPAERPNYVGLIYGAPFGAAPKIPENTPPAFLAVAQDDPLAATPELKFYEALRDAKANPELHVYRAGAHGFAMMPRNGTSDHWIDELYWWLESHGLTKP
ncbi:MAG TPA: alpha/beta hydrolase [Steroidobacteraceae bacterium]|jgi:acetyl esterase/lipase|nr:alpha/beta hydrolase [Steroidobacteraceae bacterium]